jgi:hypothetical protein
MLSMALHLRDQEMSLRDIAKLPRAPRRGGRRPAPADLRLGWESYGEGEDTLWYDDVAVGAARNGCP